MSRKKLFLAFSLVLANTVFASSASAAKIYPDGNTGSNTVFEYHRSGWVTIQPSTTGRLFSRCANNQTIVNGGFETKPIAGNQSSGFQIIHSYPASNRQWEFRLRNVDDLAREVRIYRICAH